MNATDPEIKPIHTSCKNCVFAQFEGNTQTGCQLGRLEQFRRHDENHVLEAYDESHQFYLVNGRACIAKRSPLWAEKVGPNVERTVRQEIRLKLAMVVLVEGDDEGIDQTARALLQMSLQPEETFFVTRGGTASSARLNALLMDTLGNRLTWRMLSMLSSSTSGEQIDRAVSQSKSTWYMVIRSGFAPQPHLLTQIDVALNDRLERFSALTGLDKEGNGRVIQSGLHRHPLIAGHSSVMYQDEQGEFFLCDVLDKIRYYAQMNGLDYMVKSLQEISS